MWDRVQAALSVCCPDPLGQQTSLFLSIVPTMILEHVFVADEDCVACLTRFDFRFVFAHQLYVYFALVFYTGSTSRLLQCLDWLISINKKQWNSFFFCNKSKEPDTTSWKVPIKVYFIEQYWIISHYIFSTRVENWSIIKNMWSKWRLVTLMVDANEIIKYSDISNFGTTCQHILLTQTITPNSNLSVY